MAYILCNNYILLNMGYNNPNNHNNKYSNSTLINTKLKNRKICKIHGKMKKNTMKIETEIQGDQLDEILIDMIIITMKYIIEIVVRIIIIEEIMIIEIIEITETILSTITINIINQYVQKDAK